MHHLLRGNNTRYGEAIVNDTECPTCGLLTCLDDSTEEQYCPYCDVEFDYDWDYEEVVV